MRRDRNGPQERGRKKGGSLDFVEDLSLHILDIAENAINASASLIEVEIEEREEEDLLVITICDNGTGMEPRALERALDPFYTTKEGKITGLGLPLLAQAAKEAGGDLVVRSAPGEGTEVKATFSLSHIDLKPLGDIAATLQTLIAGHPEVDIHFHYSGGNGEVVFDTRETGNGEAED